MQTAINFLPFDKMRTVTQTEMGKTNYVSKLLNAS